MKRSERYYTITMARVYEDQGYFEKAGEIYRLLGHPEMTSFEPPAKEAENKASEADGEKRLGQVVEDWVRLVYLQKRMGWVQKQWR